MMEEEKEEKKESREGGQSLARHWRAEISRHKKATEKFRARAVDTLKRYTDEARHLPEHFKNDALRGSKLNILWANTEILKTAIYARTPVPVVERRWKDPDPVARFSAEMLERATRAACDQYYDFDRLISNVRLDYLLPGRGQAWVRYIPEMGMQLNPMTGEEEETKIGERLEVDYIHWKDYAEDPGARVQQEVSWRGRRHYLTKEEAEEQFGEIAEQLNYDFNPHEDEDAVVDRQRQESEEEQGKKARIWEIWDKAERERLWIPENQNLILKREPDPYGLEGFFPCPEPLCATVTNESTVPIGDYIFYQDLALELDRLNMRISYLTRAVKAAGIYDGQFDGVQRLFSEQTENMLIPIQNWNRFAAAGGLRGSIDFIPIENYVGALQQLYIARESVLAKIYEITGISDIVRGYSDPRSTATAEQIKSQYSNLRLADRQQKVQRFIRDLIRIKAELIAEHFSPETIAEMIGLRAMGQEAQMLFMPALQLIRQDKSRGYSIEIETDSTIAIDEQAQKQERVEFLQTFSQAMGPLSQIGAQAPELIPFLGEALLFVLRAFKGGRQLEGSLEQAMQQLVGAQTQRLQAMQQQQAQGQQQEQQGAGGPNPQIEAMKVQQAATAAQQKLQLDAQKAQADIQLKREKIATDAQIKREELEADAMLEIRKQEQDRALASQKQAGEIQKELLRQRMGQVISPIS